MKRPRVRTAILGLALAVGAVGALHLPIARPLLARMGVSCPVDSVSAVQVETMHRAAVEALRGDAQAPTRSALGLAIASAREDDVRQWIAAHGLTCTAAVRGMRYLTCTNVPAADARQKVQDAIQDLTFSFDSRKRLVGVDVLRGGLTSETAAALGSSIQNRLRGELGEPTERIGTFTPPGLEGAFQTTFVKYRFSDYLVTLTAVRMPGRGVTVREQYVGIGGA